MTVFSRNVNIMALSLQGSLLSIAARAFSEHLIASDIRDAVTDAKAGHAQLYTSKILGEVLKSIETSEDPEEVLKKFIERVVLPIGGAACKEVAKKLRKLYSMTRICLLYLILSCRQRSFWQN